MKTAILGIFAAALALSGCSTVGRVNHQPDVPGAPYAGGDVCEWAKQNLVLANQYAQTYGQESYKPGAGLYGYALPRRLTDRAIAAQNNLKAAQMNIATSCADSGDDGAWACAEGHSCK